MRYIGSKSNLLLNIENFIDTNIKTPQNSFCDIFSGTACVAHYFKNKYKIISNDILYFSYVIQKAYIENNQKPNFLNINRKTKDVFSFLENSKGTATSNFIADNFSPCGKEQRMYFTEENAKRIDFIRSQIENWKKNNDIDETEYYYLLASLIEAVPSVSNITGTYGAYLKHWDKRAFKKIELPQIAVLDNQRKNEVYNEDSLDLINHISGDILYVDPPYNSRQYAPNYHLLETIAKYDNPKLSGLTGVRPYENQKSVFCSKSKVFDAFEELIRSADFSHIIVSYNSNGLMKEDFITKILKENGIGSTFSLKKIPYRKYKSKFYDESAVHEYLFYIQKKESVKSLTVEYKIPKESKLYVAEPTIKYSKYIKSPLNYIGGKYKLLPQIIPLLPSDISTFVDLFCGGCNVGININCEKVIFNDINTILTDMFKLFKNISVDVLLKKIDSQIKEWNLSPKNEEAFKAFREHYNQTRNPLELYTLSCFSFNDQFRFNNNHEYNNPFGRDRSQFSQTMRNNLISFVSKLQKTEIEFSAFDFVDYPADSINEKDFVYCDPPYLITTGSYNDGNRGFKNWTEKSEKNLYSFLDKLNERHIRFALSNVLSHKGKKNEFLADWSEKYNTVHLKKDYSNSSYNTKRMESDEVLITNYPVTQEI